MLSGSLASPRRLSGEGTARETETRRVANPLEQSTKQSKRQERFLAAAMLKHSKDSWISQQIMKLVSNCVFEQETCTWVKKRTFFCHQLECPSPIPVFLCLRAALAPLLCAQERVRIKTKPRTEASNVDFELQLWCHEAEHTCISWILLRHMSESCIIFDIKYPCPTWFRLMLQMR